MPINPVQRRYLTRILDKLGNGAYRLETVPECPCGASEAQVIAEQDRYGIPVCVVACQTCDLARTTPRLAAADLARFYEEDYHGLHTGRADPSPETAIYRLGQGHDIYRYVSPWLAAGPLRIAEIGSGTGQVLREFKAAATADGRTVEVTGCEYASAYVEEGRKAGTKLEHGSAESLLPDAPFDLVILSHVVEHFPDPVRDLRTVVDLIAESGHAYIEVPGIRAIHEKPEYAYELTQYLTAAHTYHYSLSTISQMLWRVGLEPLDGDEHVRLIARRDPSPSSRQRATQDSQTLVSYLAWLRSSPSLRLKRRLLKTRQAVRTRGLALLRRVVGEERYRAMQDIRARHRIRL